MQGMLKDNNSKLNKAVSYLHKRRAALLQTDT